MLSVVVEEGRGQIINKTKSSLDIIWKHYNIIWIRHVLRHNGLLKSILEGKMIEK